MKVIFLDIDGVLNYNGFGNDDMERYGFAPKLVNNLRKLIDKTGSKIVISSSWRMYSSINEKIIGGSPWIKILEENLGLSGVIIDKIGYKYEFTLYYARMNNIDFSSPRLDKYKGKYRGYDIKEYLNTHDNIDKFVILDDWISESDIEKVYPDNYVRCICGFSDSEYNKALNIFNWR